MSIFDKIKDSFWETGFVDELAQHFNEMGVKVTALAHDSPDAIHHTPALGVFGNVPIGSLMLEGRNIDLVEVYRTPTGGSASPGRLVYSYWYVVRMDVGNQDDFKATTEPIKNGLFKREIVGFEWKGGRMGSVLNADTALKQAVIELGLPDIGVKANKKDGYVAAQMGVRWRTLFVKGIPVKYQLTVGKDFPSKEAFDVFEEIARQIRGLATNPP